MIPGPVPHQTGGPVRGRIYVASSVVYAALEVYARGAWSALRDPVAVARTEGTSGLNVSASGTGLSYPASYTPGDQPSEGTRWRVALTSSETIPGVIWTPGADSQAVFEFRAGAQDPGANYIRGAAYLGRADLTSGFRVGYGRHLTTLVVGANADNLADGTGTTCTWTGPASAILGWSQTGNVAAWGSARGRRAGSMVTPTSTQPGAALDGGPLTFDLVATRPAAGGALGSLSGVECVFYPAVGELAY